MSPFDKEDIEAQGVPTLPQVLLSLSIPFRPPWVCFPGCRCVGTCTCAFRAPAQESNPDTGIGTSQPPRQGLHPVSGFSWPLSLSLPSTASALFADAIGLQPDARGVATSLGLNERLFVVNPQEVHELVGTGRVPGPREDLLFGGGRGGAEGRSQRGGGSWLWLLLRLKGEEKGMGLS